MDAGGGVTVFAFGIGPGDGGHIGLFARSQLHVIGAPVGVDDQIGHDVGPSRLDEDMDALFTAGPAGGVAKHPAHCIASGDRSRACQSFSRLQRDLGDMAWRGIDLIEGAGTVGNTCTALKYLARRGSTRAAVLGSAARSRP